VNIKKWKVLKTQFLLIFMQVNDLIFKELIKRGYSLEGKTRVWNIADSKLWYLTPDQAQAFLDLEQSKEYQKDVIQKEIDLINGNIGEILKGVGKGTPINIIDIGCGDGKKAVLFIGNLRDKLRIRYCPIDISNYMIAKALTRIRQLKVNEVVKFQWNVSDFENLENVTPLLRNSDFKRNLLLLLGNTLGNFEINELLYTLHASMIDDDFLLIGNGLDNRQPDDIVNSYNTKEVNNFLVKIITQIGLEEKDVEFGVRFRNSRIECYYTLLTDKKITFQDKTVYFNKWDQIIVALSYKYSKENFKKFLGFYFDDVKLHTSQDGSYALALCRKSK
jgi:uncharacterized SAM-dependent methyltransferase